MMKYTIYDGRVYPEDPEGLDKYGDYRKITSSLRSTDQSFIVPGFEGSLALKELNPFCDEVWKVGKEKIKPCAFCKNEIRCLVGKKHEHTFSQKQKKPLPTFEFDWERFEKENEYISPTLAHGGLSPNFSYGYWKEHLFEFEEEKLAKTRKWLSARSLRAAETRRRRKLDCPRCIFESCRWVSEDMRKKGCIFSEKEVIDLAYKEIEERGVDITELRLGWGRLGETIKWKSKKHPRGLRVRIGAFDGEEWTLVLDYYPFTSFRVKKEELEFDALAVYSEPITEALMWFLQPMVGRWVRIREHSNWIVGVRKSWRKYPTGEIIIDSANSLCSEGSYYRTRLGGFSWLSEVFEDGKWAIIHRLMEEREVRYAHTELLPGICKR